MRRVYPLQAVQLERCAACPVREMALFGALDEAGLARLRDAGSEAAGIADRRLSADARLYALGERGASVYTVREGLVRLERVSEQGRRCIVRVVGRGELIGAEALLGQAYADEAVACTPVAVCRIPVALVDTLRAQDAALQLALMRRWQQALDGALRWRVDLQSGPAAYRVLRLLDDLGRQAGAGMPIWLPRREEIADLLGMALETASRVVSRLRRDGVLQVLPGRRSARLQPQALEQALARALGTAERG